jgi:ribosome-binding factor A
MAQGSRPERIGEEIRQEISLALSRDVRDPGVGFVTLTRVTVSPDLQLARVYYTQLGDEKARKETRRALDRVLPFLRRRIGQRIRLRRVPELVFHFDEGPANQERIERILLDLEAERRERGIHQEGQADQEGPASRLRGASARDAVAQGAEAPAGPAQGGLKPAPPSATDPDAADSDDDPESGRS